ncbi:MAG: hypothetical protein ACXWCB_13805, partial [Acidimicrobiales bacterium]
MPPRPAAASIAVAVLLALFAGSVAMPAAGADTPTSSTDSRPSAAVAGRSVVTPVLSARRVPGLLAAHQADVALEAALQPILAQSTPSTCLTVQATGRTIESDNGDLPVMPASTEKLLT